VLHAETELEILRRKDFPNCASRLRSVYAFADRDSAERARSWGLAHFTEDNLVEVGVWPGSTVCKRDAQWISKCFLSADTSWRRAYLEGLPMSDEPIWEAVIEGKVTVLSGEFRMDLREILHAAEPDARVLLELARIGGEIGSDSGAVGHYILASDIGVRIRPILNIEGFADSGWVAAFAAYPGPFDPEAALDPSNPGVFFHVPNWRDRELWIPI